MANGTMKCPNCGRAIIPYENKGEVYYDCPSGDYNSEDERYDDYLSGEGC